MTDESIKSSLVLYIGGRNYDKLLNGIKDRSNLKEHHLEDVSGLDQYLKDNEASVIVLEIGDKSDNVATFLRMINRYTSSPIIVIAPINSIQNVVTAIHNGAYNFLPEPLETDVLFDSIYDALRMRVLWNEIHDTSNLRTASLGDIIGAAPCMQVLYQTIQSVSRTDATVFIQGPSGTGKELVAKAVHQNSDRSPKPFIAINCGAIPPNLLESELFGHEKGAFTGAVRRHIGKFEQADGGTLFLDETCELPLDLQVKLLRVLQDMQVTRVGGRESVPIDVRIICATNRNVVHEVNEGRFREDLYYRLNVVPVTTPPLKERRGDIPLLLAHFLTIFTEKYSKYFYEFSISALQHLCSYEWPGNVREMENMIERIVVLNDGAVVEEKFLPEEVIKTPILPEITGPKNTIVPENHETVKFKAIPLWQAEQNMIKTALAECGGNVIKASKILEIGQASLYRKLKLYSIDQSEYK